MVSTRKATDPPHMPMTPPGPAGMAKAMAARLNPDLAKAVGQRIEQAWKLSGFQSRKDFFRTASQGDPDEALTDYNQLSLWVNGKALVQLGSLMRVAKVCGVSLHWLAFGESEDPAALARWLDGPGAAAPREARAFLASLPLHGALVTERFYSLAFEAWRRGATPEDAVNIARTTDRHGG